MKEMNSRVSTASTRLASRSICGLLSVAMAVPVAPIAYAGDFDGINTATISKGDTASALPEVKKICDAVQSSQDGTFATKKDSFIGTNPDCSGFTRRQRDADSKCKVDLGAGLAGLSGTELQNKIDSLCGQSTGLSHDSAVYCALRSATKGGQALQYCNAYMSADKAQDGLKKTLFFDIAAAGACYGEYIAILLSKKSNVPYKGYVCGGAAMAGVLFELVQTASILGKSKDAYGDGSSHDKSAGGYKIDASNRVVERGNLGKALEITASSALSATAFYMAICYYNKDKTNGLCGQFSQSKNKSIEEAQKTAYWKSRDKKLAAEDEKLKVANTVAPTCTRENADKCMAAKSDINKSYEDKKDAAIKDAENLNAQAQIALRTAMIFTALAGMRGLSSSAAGKTKKDAEDILQSLFTSNGGTTNFGNSGVGGYQSSMYTSSNTNSFNSNTSDGSNKSASTAASADPGDSAFLAPPGSGLNQKAAAIAAAMPASAKNGDMGSAAGLGAGITAAAATAGVPASALGEIRGHVDSIFANLPKEGGGYGGGSGGGLAKKSDGGGMDGLNLKGLFGGQDKEEKAAGNESLAYRGLASDDIWHSQNPKGNNLFQIISERYDTAQRKQDLAP